MAYQITDDCIACGACMEECPNGAISSGSPYKIDPDLCLDCGACESACANGTVRAN